MNVKMEEQSAMNNDQLQVDRRLLNICRPKIRVYTHPSTQLEQSTGKDDISLLEVWYFIVARSLRVLLCFKRKFIALIKKAFINMK